jgi:D-arabinose 1-dehydrogenase-like Zn-dependent alcohol dehydrogenase
LVAVADKLAQTGDLSMTAITFDTLKFANKLKAAGVPAQQAEAEAEALSDVFEANLNELVTKETLQQELHLLEQRMTIKLGGMMTAAIAITATLVKLL